jgi:hypothetical protein
MPVRKVRSHLPPPGVGSPAPSGLLPISSTRSELQTAVLEAAPHPEQFRAYGAVLDVARITDLTNSYANAQAQLRMAQAKFDVAKSAFERAQNLVHSAILAKRDAEAAEGTFRTDQASLTRGLDRARAARRLDRRQAEARTDLQAGRSLLRRILVVGAHAVLRRARQQPEKYPWLTRLLARKPFRVVAVALANKMARIAWALLAKGGSYRAPALAAAA